MNGREAKRWRRRYYKQIDAASNMALKKEIFIARNGDILGLIVIAETVLIIFFFIFTVR
jgi:hypothetical protein